MFKFPCIALVLVALAGCSSVAMHDHAKNMISFSEADNDGHPARQLSFILTNEPTKTCIAGDWKKARVVRDVSAYTRNPAYKLENGSLEVLLINQMCDAYDSYVGELSNGRFQGEHVAYGLEFNKALGKVSGTYVAN
jgi:hypothetical protein